ncbi:hypothetical protein MERGE_001632 [Pneumocystis wakefieldiae]|uniref:Uncharacterized protein n=1 Tax=Pneumocystis wakefieldiae TaxID=38082 RepID=A0A899FWB9_9ASCO|nr:hypothetical protein MERGE_001632 [Pneumocystis wakefieldiae]
MTIISGERHQKHIKDMTQCREVAQKNVTASSIIFHQAKKQFAALKLENKSSSTSASNIKAGENVQVSVKPIGIAKIQGLPPFQNKIPALRISPSLNTMMSPKNSNSAVIRAKVPNSVIKPRQKYLGPHRHPRLYEWRGQPLHRISQNILHNKHLHRQPGTPYASLATSSPRSQIQKKSEIKKADNQQEARRKQPGAIKVISVNALNARQPKIITAENIPNNKPLRLAPSLSKANRPLNLFLVELFKLFLNLYLNIMIT